MPALKGCFFCIAKAKEEATWTGCIIVSQCPRSQNAKRKTYKSPEASAWGVTQPIRLVYSSEKLVKKPLRSVPRLLV